MATLAEIRAQHPEYADMSDQQLADGLYKKFYSDMPRAQFDAKVGLAKEPSPAVKAGQDIAYAGQWDHPQSNMLEQGLSGLNEGIAQGLGLPVDLATMGINAGTGGVNALLHTNIPQIDNPVGGSGTFTQMLSPTIKPPTDNPADQMTRRISQEVGAMLIPGIGPVARSAKPLSTAAKELVASLGSGTGAATAQQIAPGNPLAEFAGQMAGGFAPGSIARMAERKAPAVSMDALRGDKNAAYKATQNLGISYKPQAYDNLLTEILTDAKNDHISPTRHERAYSFIADMVNRRGQPMTLTELDQLRQEVYRDLIKPGLSNDALAADAHFGEIIKDNIDAFLAKAGPNEVLSGDAADANAAIIKARDLNSKYRKTQLIEDAVTKATRRTASTGSGGNINNAIRQNIRAILDNPKKAAAFTADEKARMEALIKQGNLENLLRLVGKFSPGGNGLMGMLQVGGTILNPHMAALPVAGMVAKGIADNKVINDAMALRNRVATGAPAPKVGMTPDQRAIAQALLAAQASTQKKPLQITVNGGAR